jgi:parallel beta-helix repeat protein
LHASLVIGVRAASLRDVCIVGDGVMGSSAITIDGNSDMIIEGCDISSKNGSGIHVAGRAYPVVTRTQIHDCHTHGMLYCICCILLCFGNENEWNDELDHLIGIVINDASHGRYHYNTIQSCRGYGVYIRGDSIAKFDTNTIYANGMADVVNESTRSVVTRNTSLEVHPTPFLSSTSSSLSLSLSLSLLQIRSVPA